MFALSRCLARVAFLVALSFALRAQNFCDDLESYAPGDFVTGSLPNAGGWIQFPFSPAIPGEAVVFDSNGSGPVPAHDGTQYLGTRLNADVVHTFTTSSGKWNVGAWTYVPLASAAAMQDSQWFVVLNDFAPTGPFTWATQIEFDPLLGQVLPDHGISLAICQPQYGTGLPLVYDAWVELRIEVDLDLDRGSIYYGGQAVGDPFVWSQGPFGTNGGIGLPCPAPTFTAPKIGAIDVFANASLLPNSWMYWDDISVLRHAPRSYCTAGTSSAGCSPVLQAANQPSLSTPAPCFVTCTNADAQRSGLFFYSLAEQSPPLAWGASSVMCVQAPRQRTTPSNSGGNAGACDGSFSLDLPAWIAAHPGALGAPFACGQSVFGQQWYRDPTTPPTTRLSNALELTFTP